MKKTLIYALAASVAVLASCAKEATVKEAPAKETVPCTISFGADTTKSYINYEGHTFWADKDLITVFSDHGTVKTFIAATKDGKGNTHADFTCADWVSDETPVWAIFCYEEKAAPSKPYNVALTADGVFSANVSEFQPITISHNYGSFGSKANISVAEITNNQGTYSGTMKNALGLVKITIPAGVEDISEIILEDAAGTAPIAGKVSIDCTGDNPVCTPVSGQGKSKISAKWAGKDSESFTAGKPIFFCVIPGVSFTPKFTFVKTDGSKAYVTGNKAISVSRNKYFDCGTPEVLIPEGMIKKVVTLTFGANPFNENIPGASTWKKARKLLPLTHTTADDYTFSYVLKNSEVAKTAGTETFSSYKLDTASSSLIFYGANGDLTEYLQIDCPTGGKLVTVSVALSTELGKPNKTIKITDLSDNEITKKTTPFTQDLMGTAASDGCRLMFVAKNEHWFKEIKVTYFIPEETE